MTTPTRQSEHTVAGLRLSYDAIDWDDASDRAWLAADLRNLANDAGSEASGSNRPQWWIEDPDQRADAVAEGAGWARVRTLVQLRRPLPIDPPPEVPGVRTFDVDRDVEAWLALNNVAFSWHPEQGHQNRDGLAIELAAPWVDLDGFFVVDAASADHAGSLDGFCWTKFHPATGDDPSLGEVYVIATAARARGRGLGRALVEVAMDYQHRVQGAEVAMLWTEDDNEAAMKLYQNMGYEVHHANVAFAPAGGA